MIRSRIVNPADLASLTKRVLRGWITGNLSSRRACTGSNHTEKKSDEEQVFLLIYIPLHKNLAFALMLFCSAELIWRCVFSRLSDVNQ